MSEEEAIDILKNSISDYVIGDYCSKCEDYTICEDRDEDCYYIEAIDTIINRVKELEEIEEEHRKENAKLQEKLDNEIENHKVLSLDISQACVDLGLPEDTIIADEMVLEIKKRYIPKSKIKEKIEEVDNYRVTESVNPPYYITKKGVEIFKADAELILQELLEE